MNAHLTSEISSFCVVNLRNSPAITCNPRLESEYFRRNLHRTALFRGALDVGTVKNLAVVKTSKKTPVDYFGDDDEYNTKPS